jgi:hypothetical protein
MSKLISEMETHEIMTYLKRERYIHGLFYVDRDSIMSRFEIEISDNDWLGFANFFTEGFNRRNGEERGRNGKAVHDWRGPYVHAGRYMGRRAG